MVKNVFNGEKVHWSHESCVQCFIFSGMSTIAAVQIHGYQEH